MRTFSGATNTVHDNDLTGEARAYFTATGARLREEVWLRVEARLVGDGTPVHVTLFREDDEGDRETLQEFDGTLSGGEWEQRWKVELPPSRTHALHGPIHLRFEAAVDGLPLTAQSQALLVHRTRFSS